MGSSRGTRVPVILAQARALWLHNAAIQLQAVNSKTGASAPAVTLKGAEL
jgi:hypothetical protein